jgi:phosphoglycerate dehydrogenase-like enzyme
VCADHRGVANRHLIDRVRLQLMKPSAYLINTARGGLVDEAALAEAVAAGAIAGVALDVQVIGTKPVDDRTRPLWQFYFSKKSE